MKKNTSEINKNNSNALIATIMSCVMAPLVSHLLELFIPSNPWTSEMVLVLFFSAISGYVICNELERLFRKSYLAKKGFDIKSMGLPTQIIWTMPSLLVFFFYDTKIGAIAILCFVLVTILILLKRKDDIKFTKTTYCTFILYSIMTIGLKIIYPETIDFKTWYVYTIMMFVVGFASWVLFEILKLARIKSLQRKNHKMLEQDLDKSD